MQNSAGHRFPGTARLLIAGIPMGLLIPSVRDGLVEVFSRPGLAPSGLTLKAHPCSVPPESRPGQSDTRPDDLCIGIAAGSGEQDPAGILQNGFADMARSLQALGLIPGWRDECFSVRKPDGTVWFALERACFRPLGLVSTAVHAHAWCDNGDTWLGRRAHHKATDPGLLDNLAAGGLTHGEAPDDCMVRELGEEAGVPETLARTVQALPERILSERLEAEGIHREWLHCYTLRLPDNFTPVNRDGEVIDFTRYNTNELQTCMASGEMTADAVLCAALALRCRRTL